MHSGIDVISPGAIAIVAGFVIAWVCSLAIVIDALRRKAWDFTGVGEGRWPYIAVAGAYALVFLAVQVPAISQAAPWLGTVQVLGTPVLAVTGVAYLLRVVFPTPARLEARSRARDAGLQ